MPHKIKKIREYDILEKLEESNYALIYRVKDSAKKTPALKLSHDASPEYNELIAWELEILEWFEPRN